MAHVVWWFSVGGEDQNCLQSFENLEAFLGRFGSFLGSLWALPNCLPKVVPVYVLLTVRSSYMKKNHPSHASPRGQGSTCMGAEQPSPAFVSYQVVHLRRPLRRRPSFASLAFISSQSLATPVTVCGAPSSRPAPKLSCTSAFIWRAASGHSPACHRLPCCLTPKEMHFSPVSAMGQIQKPQPGSPSGALSTRSLPRALVKYQRCPRDTPNTQPVWNWPMESGLAWRTNHKQPRNMGDTLKLPGREKVQQRGSVWWHFDPAVKQRLSRW